MQPIIDVIERDKKKRKLRKFLSLTVGHGIKLVIPLLSAAALYLLKEAPPPPGVFASSLNLPLFMSLLVPNVFNLMFSLFTIDKTGQTGVVNRYYFPEYWQRKLNKTIVKELKEAENQLIEYLKQPLNDSQKANLKLSLITHKSLIKEWYQDLFKRQTLQNGYSTDKAKSEKEQTEIIFNKIDGIIDTIENLKVNNSALREGIEKIYINENENLQLYPFNKLYAQHLLDSRLYTKLKPSDYTDIEKSFKEQNFEILDFLILKKYNTFINWAEVSQLFSKYYDKVDSNYHNKMALMKQLIENQLPAIQNEQILSGLSQSIADITKPAVVTLNLLNYTPTRYKELWEEIKEKYTYINHNKSIVSPEHFVALNDWIDKTLPMLVKSDSYLNNTKNTTANTQKVDQQLKLGLENAKEFFTEIINFSEEELIKSLSTHNKHMSMRKK